MTLLSIRWAIIKRFVTKQCNPALKRDDWMKLSKLKRKESTLWQRRFWEHQIRWEGIASKEHMVDVGEP